jgi:hypothetical protein
MRSVFWRDGQSFGVVLLQTMTETASGASADRVSGELCGLGLRALILSRLTHTEILVNVRVN